METITFKTKVDLWIPLLAIGSIVFCFIGPAITGDWLYGAILAVGVVSIEIFTFSSIKYQIKGDQLGVRSFYRWTWYQIDKIVSIKPTRSILSAPALSFNRLAIKFSTRSILKSAMPLEISPVDREQFIRTLLDINPNIEVLSSNRR